MRARSLIALALLVAPPGAAEVTASTDASFTVTQKVTIAAPAAKVWATLVAPSLWWNKDHTWSGSAANLSLDPRPGGCWCERLPNGGGVEHMRVVYAAPDEMLRLTGGLGPLQAMPASAVMTVTLTPAADGKSTAVAFTYAVAGAPGLGQIAAPVGGVLGAQVAGLKAAAERP